MLFTDFCLMYGLTPCRRLFLLTAADSLDNREKANQRMLHEGGEQKPQDVASMVTGTRGREYECHAGFKCQMMGHTTERSDS